MTTISALTAEDRPSWDELWVGYLAAYEHPLPPEISDATFQRLIDPEVQLYGALARSSSGQVLGLVHWLPHLSTWADLGYCYLEDLFVAPSARARGVGKLLIGHVEQWARDRGYAKVHWLTRRSNATARLLYEQLGEDPGLLQYQIRL